MRRASPWPPRIWTCRDNDMRKFISFLVLLSLTACGGGGSTSAPQPTGCSNNEQKQFVLEALYAWYLWNDLLPANINIANYATPEELVFRVTTELGPQDANDNPIDLWSSLGSAVADQQFFGEGKYEGFGFSYRPESANLDDMWFTRVFSGSPADQAGFARGQRVLSLNGTPVATIVANQGIGAVLDSATVTFEVQRPDATTFTATVTKAIVTIDPVPQFRLIDVGQGVPPAGFFELAQFISTADPEFGTIFSQFAAAGVTDVVIDMRYNGGGLVRTAELLGDYLGSLAYAGEVFSQTEFNADRAPANNTVSLFSQQANALNLSRLVVVASDGTASASELVINSMAPYVDVTIVGDNTYGKPVGQVGFEFCEKILRPTSFRTTNALGQGDYFGGLPVDCAVPDDLAFAVGADDDPNLQAALSVLTTGACPVASLTGGQFKPQGEMRAPRQPHTGRLERDLGNAY